MKKYLLAFFCFFTTICFTQERSEKDLLKNTGLQKITIKSSKDTIEYLITEELPSQKGIVFYSQGSLPMPLMLNENGNLYTTFPFDYGAFYNDYRFVVVSKPSIPIIADSSNVDERKLYINNEGVFPKGYLQTHYLSHYTNTLDKVINHVIKNSEKDYKKVILFGHSQGARVVAKAANINKAVTHLVYLSGNPLGRIDESIRRKREAVLCGQLSEQEAHDEIQAIYEQWKAINKNKYSLEVTGKGDSNYTWFSFLENTIDDLLNLTIPIFVGYGTKDVTARYCDLLPLDFIKHQKTNLTHRPYLGYDHSFFKVNPYGKPDLNEQIVFKVGKDAMDWVEKH